MNGASRCWASLPADALAYIINECGLAQSDVASIRLVCVHWRSTTNSHLKSLAPACTSLEQVASIALRFPYLTNCDLTRCDTRLVGHASLCRDASARLSSLLAALARMPSLTSLHISDTFSERMGQKHWASLVCAQALLDVSQPAASGGGEAAAGAVPGPAGVAPGAALPALAVGQAFRSPSAAAATPLAGVALSAASPIIGSVPGPSIAAPQAPTLPPPSCPPLTAGTVSPASISRPEAPHTPAPTPWAPSAVSPASGAAPCGSSCGVAEARGPLSAFGSEPVPGCDPARSEGVAPGAEGVAAADVVRVAGDGVAAGGSECGGEATVLSTSEARALAVATPLADLIIEGDPHDAVDGADGGLGPQTQRQQQRLIPTRQHEGEREGKGEDQDEALARSAPSAAVPPFDDGEGRRVAAPEAGGAEVEVEAEVSEPASTPAFSPGASETAASASASAVVAAVEAADVDTVGTAAATATSAMGPSAGHEAAAEEAAPAAAPPPPPPLVLSAAELADPGIKSFARAISRPGATHQHAFWLPDWCGRLAGLQELQVRGRQRPSSGLPPCLLWLHAGRTAAQLTSLTLVRLSLVTLPEQLQHLTGLTRLVAQDCSLSLMPRGVASGLSRLQFMDLSLNGLTALPPDFTQLTALRHLDLQRNKLAALPHDIGRLSGVTALLLNNNQLRQLPASLASLRCVELLSCSYNWLGGMGPSLPLLCNLPRLRRLELACVSDVRCRLVPPLELRMLAANLTHLDLAANNLVPADVLGSLTSLRSLVLSDCGLLAVPPWVRRLAPSLQHLDLSNNSLSELPSWLSACTRLRYLSIAHNRLSIRVPPTVLEQMPQLEVVESE